MKTDDKPRFAVNHKPDVVFNTRDFHNCFIRMPLVGIQVQKRHEPDSHIVKQRRKVMAPVAYCGMRNLNVKGSTQNQTDISK